MQCWHSGVSIIAIERILWRYDDLKVLTMSKYTMQSTVSSQPPRQICTHFRLFCSPPPRESRVSGYSWRSQLNIVQNYKATILKATKLKIARLLPTATKDMHMKFETEIPKQTWVTLLKPCRLQSPETEKSNMATRQPFRKWGNWKSTGSYSYTQVLGHWSFEFIFKAKLKLRVWKPKNPIWLPGGHFEINTAENQ